MTNWLDLGAELFDAGARPVQESLFVTPAPTVAPGQRARRGAQLAGQTDLLAELAGDHAADAGRAALLEEGRIRDRLGRGEAIPGGPGACARPGCGHAQVWHSPTDRRRPCEKCDCPAFVRPAAEVTAAAELAEARAAHRAAEARVSAADVADMDEWHDAHRARHAAADALEQATRAAGDAHPALFDLGDQAPDPAAELGPAAAAGRAAVLAWSKTIHGTSPADPRAAWGIAAADALARGAELPPFPKPYLGDVGKSRADTARRIFDQAAGQ